MRPASLTPDQIQNDRLNEQLNRQKAQMKQEQDDIVKQRTE